MKKLLLLYNPRAGRAHIARNLDSILQKFCKAGYEPIVYPTIEGMGAEEVLDARGVEGIDLVVCCGGDGTLHHAVNGLLKYPDAPPLGYLPAGSTNDFAASLGLPKTIDGVVNTIIKGSPKALDVGDFSGQVFNYVAAFGAFAAVSYSTTQSSKNSMGHLAYIMEGLRNLPLGQVYHAKVEVNDQVFEDDYIFGTVCNTNYIGGFSMAGTVDTMLDDGQFEVLLIKSPQNVLELNALLVKLLARDFDNEYMSMTQTDHVKFTFQQPIAWTLDGEFGGETEEVEISVRPGALKMQL